MVYAYKISNLGRGIFFVIILFTAKLSATNDKGCLMNYGHPSVV